MMLDPRREKFAQGVADGLSLAEAYRAANQKQAKRWKAATVWQQASRWMADVDVSARVEQIRAALAEKALWKREDSVRILAQIAGNGEKDADRVRAVAELNSMHGFDAPKQLDLLNSDGSLRPAMIQIVAKQ